jgi:exodeoxyribonuclease VII large subunit
MAAGMLSDAPPRVVWTVSALLVATADTLQARFGALAVRGELSGFTRAASGHCYFSLKDSDGAAALLRCAMFRRAAALLDFAPADGQQVELRGRIGVYEARGELQIVVESLQRVGAGTLYEEFLRLRARLEAQGLFDAARKRPLPRHPRAVGIVTSPGAAALRDVLASFARRVPQLPLVIYPSPVQGADAPAALVAALQLAAARREVDTLLLVRGGGALEDLWAFNDERVVRAVAACPLPVVCGVGHESDITLADLAADLRAPTPTAAAELATPSRDELSAELDALARAAQQAVGRRLDQQAQRLDTLALRLGRPARSLAAQRQALEGLAQRWQSLLARRIERAGNELEQRRGRLVQAAALQLERRAQRLALAGDRLQALDPARVLQRGYAWVEGADARPIVAARALAAGQVVRAVWADGSARAEVLDIRLDGSDEQGGAPKIGGPGRRAAL